MTRLQFRLLYRGRRLRVEVNPDHAIYELLDGDPLEIVTHGEPITVERGTPQQSPIPPAPQYPPPHAPAGREPGFVTE
jgi:alpha,alpha-trehalose phosphorylase